MAAKGAVYPVYKLMEDQKEPFDPKAFIGPVYGYYSTTDGKLLVAANNAEDPPFGTLFKANGDNPVSSVAKITKITVDPTIIPTGFGLSIEQPAWDPKTRRFYVSIPVIANDPPGCNFGQLPGAITTT